MKASGHTKTYSPRSYSAKAGEVEQKWHVVDATGQTLGRISSQIAKRRNTHSEFATDF